MSIFLQALAQKIRVSGFGKGVLTIEDLFDIPVETLNQAALAKDAQIAQTGQQGYLRTKTAANTTLQLERDIIVSVLQYKLDQQDLAHTTAQESAEERELRELIHAKRQEAKKAKSLEELEAEYNEKYASK